MESASQNDFNMLKEEMKKASLKDVKKVNNFRQQDLNVLAEFTCNGNFTLLEVTNATAMAAIKTGKKYSFTVIKERKMNSQ